MKEEVSAAVDMIWAFKISMRDGITLNGTMFQPSRAKGTPSGDLHLLLLTLGELSGASGVDAVQRSVMQKQTAKIDNWVRLGNRLVGSISYDLPRDVPSPGEIQRTSQIVRLDEDRGTCETRNTIYRLGRTYRGSAQ